MPKTTSIFLQYIALYAYVQYSYNLKAEITCILFQKAKEK